MKHLKLKGRWNRDEQCVEVSLVHRTHTDYNFGDESCISTRGTIYPWAFKHGRVVLASDRSEICITHDSIFRQHVGEDVLVLNIPDKLMHGPSASYVLVNLDEWSQIKAAVEAYNEHFK